MQFRDDHEELIAEQAVLAYRATVRAADEAACGRGMEAIEDAAFEGSQAHGRRLLELAMERVAAQKRKRRARTAGGRRTSNGPRHET